MATSSALLDHPEATQVGRKPSPRKRARDEGTVTPLGVEVKTTIFNAAEQCRASMQWSKRTLVENALREYLTAKGFPPEEEGDDLTS
jgi:hypothetical protein